MCITNIDHFVYRAEYPFGENEIVRSQKCKWRRDERLKTNS